MSDNLENNAFAGLFGSVQEVQNFVHNHTDGKEPSTSKENELSTSSTTEDVRGATSSSDVINSIIEDVFRITISKRNVSQPLVFVEETATTADPEDKLDITNLEQALFERLLLEEPEKHVRTPPFFGNAAINHHVIEREVLTYLFECHKALMDLRKWKPEHLNTITEMSALVIRNTATALTQPDLYSSQPKQLHKQLINLLNDFDSDHFSSFVNSFADLVLSEEGEDHGTDLLTAALTPVLDEIKACVKNSSLLTLNRLHMYLIQYLSSNSTLGIILLRHSTPNTGHGSLYGETLFGAILSITCLPKLPNYDPTDPFDYNHAQEASFWSGLKLICDSMHTVFFNLFKNSIASRHALLSWIGNCLQANESRGQLANLHHNMFAAPNHAATVSDGFMINLGGVLLRLCAPFTERQSMGKLLKVDPTYCAVEIQDSTEASQRGVHLRGLSNQTCFISLNADVGNEGPVGPVQRSTASSYNFVTEMFFMTHRAIDLGARVVFEKWMVLTQDISRQQQLQTARGHLRSEPYRMILDDLTKRSIAMRAVLLEPSNLSALADFCVATAEWLVQVAIHSPVQEDTETYAPLNYLPLTFPLPDYVPDTLSCVPEFLMENYASFLTMVRHLAPHQLEERGATFLEPLLSQVLVFMGSRQRLRNPHLRARLAECLESLLPNRESFEIPPPPSVNREILFKYHPLRTQIVPCLLNVFVGIELTSNTGENVGFEQKFNYRRPMYDTMDYLWTIPEQRDVFKALAVEAEANMDATEPPIFLHFINFLIDDANYLLDESLANMATLRVSQNARDNGEWDSLTPEERAQNERHLIQVGMIARFDNILGKETIHTLEYITTEIKSIFCDRTFVERIASMLNYFLIHLVGPKKKNLKVKDQQEYDFRPGDLVKDICKIYINLGTSDAFCSAVSSEGRSYNPQLFQQAEQVLVRVGGGMLISDLMQVASRVTELAQQMNEDEEVYADAPEEFCDPLLSTLMEDPVILPSSKAVCDRSSIARHLLSDQTDPFTKVPLTMNQVTPDVELKARIEAWKNERRSQRGSQENTNVSNE